MYRIMIEEEKEALSTESVTGGRETVLVVEDELAILKMIRVMLEQLGYTVLAAGTPTEALQLAESHVGSIDLLLTDVIMPEMNGRDLANKLLDLDRHIRPLYMSGYTANVIAHHGVLDKGVQFIAKPFSKNDLSLKIREVLSQNPNLNGGTISSE
jgi:CheY-like chemotaxis protein